MQKEAVQKFLQNLGFGMLSGSNILHMANFSFSIKLLSYNILRNIEEHSQKASFFNHITHLRIGPPARKRGTGESVDNTFALDRARAH